jgi:HD-GYP domain-containing protein (c-di-GMP phosphodiesterase class II)
VFADAAASLAEALHAKDAYTRGHSARVGFYAELIARTIGLAARDVREIRLGAELHDIGKIGVQDTLLRKDAGLVGEEETQLRQHPLIGEQILAPLLRLHPTVLEIVRWHHERFDGQGFPDGLSGSLIPLGSRIVAIADAFDAMTSRRPYRSALPFTVAVRELVRESGRQFDPSCVRAFMVALGRLMSPATTGTTRRAPVRALVLTAWIPGPPAAVLAWHQHGHWSTARMLPMWRRSMGAFDLPRRSRGPPDLSLQ